MTGNLWQSTKRKKHSACIGSYSTKQAFHLLPALHKWKQTYTKLLITYGSNKVPLPFLGLKKKVPHECVLFWKKKKKKNSKFSSQLKAAMKNEKGIALFETGPPPGKSQELSQHDRECNAQRRRANTTEVDTYTNADYHKWNVSSLRKELLY